MTIYRLGNAQDPKMAWTEAVSITPRSRVICWRCPACGRGMKYPAGSFDVTVEGGRKYPDLLSCGAFPLLIISERVLSSWKANGIGPFISYPVQVTSLLDTDLRIADAPSYSRIDVVGVAKVDMIGSGGTVKDFCPRCGGFRTDPILIKHFKLLPGSWGGNPIFRDQQFFPFVVFCTDVLKELVNSEEHTNFNFVEMSTYVNDRRELTLFGSSRIDPGSGQDR